VPLFTSDIPQRCLAAAISANSTCAADAGTSPNACCKLADRPAMTGVPDARFEHEIPPTISTAIADTADNARASLFTPVMVGAALGQRPRFR